MVGLAAKSSPEALAKVDAAYDDLSSVLLFSGLGLLISITILVVDQFSIGEWF